MRRVGYAPVSFETILEPDRTLVLDVRLRTLQTLDRVVVSGERRSTDLARTGFYDRQHAALGSFISPQRVDSLSRWVTSSAQLLRDTRGLDVTCTGGRCGVSPRMPPNCLNLFVDGALTNAQMDDVLTLGVVAAIEVYERPIIVPAEFQGPLRQKARRGSRFRWAPQIGRASCRERV